MIKQGKIDKVKLSQMLRQGKTGTECAEYFHCSSGRITQVRQELNLNVVRSVALEDAHRVVGKNLDAVAQLQKINDAANDLLDKAVESKNHDFAVKCMAEIRGQLKLQLDLFQALYDVKEIQAFQNEVLNFIEEVSPNARNTILQRLKERRAVRAAVSIT